MFLNENYLMNVVKFIDNELNEREKLINERVNLINQGFDPKVVCNSVDIDKEFRCNVSRFLYDISYCYSYAGYKFDYFCNRDPKQLYIGSDPATKIKLFNSLKYQVITNYELFDQLESDQLKKFLMIMFLVKLSSNINNSITFNSDYDIKQKCYRSVVYDPVRKCDFIRIVNDVYQQIYVNNDYKVLGLNNNYYDLPARYIKNKRGCIKDMRFFSKEKLVELIEEYVSEFNSVPNCEDLSNFYNQKSGYYEKVFSDPGLQMCTTRIVQKYIKDYDLQDRIKMRKRRTKKEIQDSQK